jgi:Fumarylacetoacetate (FAA) hydrolase family
MRPSRGSSRLRSRSSSASSQTPCEGPATRSSCHPQARTWTPNPSLRSGSGGASGVCPPTTRSPPSPATRARTTSAPATSSSTTASGYVARASTPSARSCRPSSESTSSATSGLRIVQRLNGEALQDSSTAELIFGVPAIVAHASTVFTLEPGDLILTGTPSRSRHLPRSSCGAHGRGRGRGRARRHGTLRSPVIAEQGDENASARRCSAPSQLGQPRARATSIQLQLGPPGARGGLGDGWTWRPRPRAGAGALPNRVPTPRV